MRNNPLENLNMNIIKKSEYHSVTSCVFGF